MINRQPKESQYDENAENLQGRAPRNEVVEDGWKIAITTAQ